MSASPPSPARRPGSVPDPSLLRMSGPLIVSFWMRAAVTFVDTAFAATIGDAAVAAIGLAVPFEFLMIALWVGVSTGLTSGLSRAMGANLDAQVDQLLRASWRIVLTLSPGFLLVGAGIALWAPHMGLDPEVARQFRIYGSVLVGGSALTTFWSILPDSVVKAHQDTRSTMWAGIWSNLVNVGLNALFVLVFGWGIFGIALSTVIGRLAGLVYALARARHHERLRKAQDGPGDRTLDPHPYRRIFNLAVPASLTFALIALETGLINWLLSRMQNATEAIAAYSIYYRVLLFALQPVIATCVAMLPFAARRFGAGDVAGARAGLRQASVASAVYSVLIVGPAMLLLAPWLANALSESERTARYAEFALRLVPLGCLTGAGFLLCRPVFEALHRGTPGLVMAAFRYVVLTGPLAWAGIVAARALEQPPLYGLLVGLLAAASVSSVVFYVWLQRELPPDRAPGAG